MNIENPRATDRFIYTSGVTPERSAVLVQAAAEFAGTTALVASTYDLNDPEQSNVFASKVRIGDARILGHMNEDGSYPNSFPPRTIAEIMREVVEPARKAGKMVGVVLEAPIGQDGLNLGPFWNRTREIEAQRSHTQPNA